MRYDTEAALRALYGSPNRIAAAKDIDFIDSHCRRFIALSPFVHIATSDGVRLDVSPKGDRPGFVHVLDDRNLLIPDWPGNNRIDGLLNIVRHGRVGLIFMIPNVKETLRINGRASIHDDAAWLELCAHQGKPPITVIRVETEEVFLHCAKAFMRSRLWQPETWPDRSALPSAGQMIKDHAALDGPPEDDREAEAGYAKALY